MERNKDPAMIPFVYRTGLSNSLEGEQFKAVQKDTHKSNELCSHTVNEDNKLYTHSSEETCVAWMEI